MGNEYSGGRQGGQYRPLSPDQIERIHQAALSILENIGFTYEQGLDGTLAMLEDAGAIIASETIENLFPTGPDSVTDFKSTPAGHTLQSRWTK